MSPEASDRLVRTTMWALAAAFAAVGLVFLVAPDHLLHWLTQLGEVFGSFSPPAHSGERFWLGLAVAYMTVITGIAIVVAIDPIRYRPLLLVLAAGKATSSLTSLVFFINHDVFAYLVNAIVDGALVGVAMLGWELVGRSSSTRAEAEPAVPG